MARIDKASVDEVVRTADMLEVVGLHTQLRKAGVNYTGLCPFHQEKTPSFSVDPVEKLYYCFGCGAGGDLIGFVEKTENLTFAEAIESLADRYGVTLRYEETGATDAGRKRRDRLRRLLDQSCAYYERVLWAARAAEAARAYLAGRGLGEEAAREFRLGYSLTAWSKLRDSALAKGFTEKELLDAGLTVPGKRGAGYDRFRGRLMFPLTDERGRVLGFGARTLGDEKPKYLNSPETPLYHKSETLFGLDKAKQPASREDALFVVEGYTDVLALVQAGVRNVVASMGTALTEEQLKRLARLTRNLCLCFDADSAGRNAMDRALTVGRSLGITLRVVRVPDGLDPADFILSGHDADAFKALAVDAETLLQFRIRTVLSSHDLATPEGRIAAFTSLKGVLAQAASPLELDEEVRHVADRLRLSEENIRYLLSAPEAAARERGLAGRTARATGGGMAREDRVLTGAHELEIRFLAGCLAVPDEGRAYLAAIDASFFSTRLTREACEQVISRLNPSRVGKKEKVPERDEAEARGSLMPEIVVRSGQEAFNARVLEELSLRIQEAYLGRLIAKLKVSLAADESEAEEKKLVELEGMRREIRESIRLIPVEE
jgi:DNA primase